MGITDKLKNIVNWQSAVVLMFYFGGLVAIVIYGASMGIEILYIGGLIAMGIPTSIFGAVGQRATIQNTKPTETKKTDEVSLAIAELTVLVADLKSEVQLMQLGNIGCEEIEWTRR